MPQDSGYDITDPEISGPSETERRSAVQSEEASSRVWEEIKQVAAYPFISTNCNLQKAASDRSVVGYPVPTVTVTDSNPVPETTNRSSTPRAEDRPHQADTSDKKVTSSDQKPAGVSDLEVTSPKGALPPSAKHSENNSDVSLRDSQETSAHQISGASSPTDNCKPIRSEKDNSSVNITVPIFGTSDGLIPRVEKITISQKESAKHNSGTEETTMLPPAVKAMIAAQAEVFQEKVSRAVKLAEERRDGINSVDGSHSPNQTRDSDQPQIAQGLQKMTSAAAGGLGEITKNYKTGEEQRNSEHIPAPGESKVGRSSPEPKRIDDSSAFETKPTVRLAQEARRLEEFGASNSDAKPAGRVSQEINAKSTEDIKDTLRTSAALGSIVDLASKLPRVADETIKTIKVTEESGAIKAATVYPDNKQFSAASDPLLKIAQGAAEQLTRSSFNTQEKALDVVSKGLEINAAKPGETSKYTDGYGGKVESLLNKIGDSSPGRMAETIGLKVNDVSKSVNETAANNRVTDNVAARVSEPSSPRAADGNRIIETITPTKTSELLSKIAEATTFNRASDLSITKFGEMNQSIKAAEIATSKLADVVGSKTTEARTSDTTILRLADIANVKVPETRTSELTAPRGAELIASRSSEISTIRSIDNNARSTDTNGMKTGDQGTAKSEPGKIADSTVSAGHRQDSIGTRVDSAKTETAGVRTETAAGRTETAGGRTETAAGRTETAGGRTETAGGRTETAGVRAELAGVRVDGGVKLEPSSKSSTDQPIKPDTVKSSEVASTRSADGSNKSNDAPSVKAADHSTKNVEISGKIADVHGTKSTDSAGTKAPETAVKSADTSATKPSETAGTGTGNKPVTEASGVVKTDHGSVKGTDTSNTTDTDKRQVNLLDPKTKDLTGEKKPTTQIGQSVAEQVLIPANAPSRNTKKDQKDEALPIEEPTNNNRNPQNPLLNGIPAGQGSNNAASQNSNNNGNHDNNGAAAVQPINLPSLQIVGSTDQNCRSQSANLKIRMNGVRRSLGDLGRVTNRTFDWKRSQLRVSDLSVSNENANESTEISSEASDEELNKQSSHRQQDPYRYFRKSSLAKQLI